VAVLNEVADDHKMNRIIDQIQSDEKIVFYLADNTKQGLIAINTILQLEKDCKITLMVESSSISGIHKVDEFIEGLLK